MKKRYIILFILMCAVVLGSVTSCTKKNIEPKNENKKITIICTIFPEYDWVHNIVGSDSQNIDIMLLLDKGVDIHSYQPTVVDIAKIASCDMLVYTGGESSEWIEDVLKEAVNKNIVKVNLMHELDFVIKEELLIEGMQKEHEHDDEAEEEHHHEEETEYDEHIWLSLKCAQNACSVIAEKLSKLDNEHAAAYEANCRAYKTDLAALDSEYAVTVAESRTRTILFADRFPFRYLADDYNLHYYAAFVGCSAETEASFETIVFLANKLDELKLPVVLTIENPRHNIAQTIIKNSANLNRTIKAMDSMQSVTAAHVASGTTYLAIMRENLEALKEALK